jgi:hypothetical protein
MSTRRKLLMSLRGGGSARKRVVTSSCDWLWIPGECGGYNSGGGVLGGWWICNGAFAELNFNCRRRLFYVTGS